MVFYLILLCVLPPPLKAASSLLFYPCCILMSTKVTKTDIESSTSQTTRPLCLNRSMWTLIVAPQGSDFIDCCKSSALDINMSKKKGMVMDFRKILLLSPLSQWIANLLKSSISANSSSLTISWSTFKQRFHTLCEKNNQRMSSQ